MDVYFDQTVENENELQAKKNELLESQKEVEQARQDYLDAVIQAAIAKEALIRKKERVYRLSLSVVIVFAGIVLGIINSWLAGAFVGVIVLAFIILKVYRKETDKDDYSHRKDFFMKYKDSIPADTKLKWKDTVHWY